MRNLLSLILGSFLIVSLSYADPVPSSGSPIPMGTGFTEVSKEDGTSPCSGYLLKFTDAPTDNADGSCSVAGGAGTLGGADTQVQFNDGGALAGEATFIYNKALNSLSIDRIVIGPGVADYLMPTARGAANTYLRDNGSGAITFSALSGIGPANFTASTDFGDVNTDAGGALRYGGDSIDPAAINWGAYTYLGEEGISLVEAYAAVGTFESGDTFICYEAGVGARECDYDDLPAAGSMTSFIVEDGDGTEISISDAEEWKFVEGTGIDIDWTDTTPGSDADPFDLTFTVDLTVGELDTTALTASEILITDASKDIISAAVATYPSLAELAYVKGVTSAIQTQITTNAELVDTGAELVAIMDNAAVDMGTGVWTAAGFVGPLTGEASTATALAANGGNCGTATHFAVGVDADGAAECEAIGDADIPDSTTVTGWTMGASVATTPAADDSDTSIATTAYVQGEINARRWSDCRTLETPVDADDDIPVWAIPQAFTATDVYCNTSGGTSIAITIGDGTNSFEAITCDDNGATDDGSITNATFTADEPIEWDFGAPTGAVDWVMVCLSGTIATD